ncbi:hypothetical protein COLO4_23960 [Corchorus olitorius]|uniref:Uncharacterized protein n=1 Tax=Corchorus olitorius TaxID=93759 RepID=A0A1R3IDT6_9ROSI|nr:hypothetical protein COLO4_23960 [Corchorus olitorius]
MLHLMTLEHILDIIFGLPNPNFGTDDGSGVDDAIVGGPVVDGLSELLYLPLN